MLQKRRNPNDQQTDDKVLSPTGYQETINKSIEQCYDIHTRMDTKKKAQALRWGG